MKAKEQVGSGVNKGFCTELGSPAVGGAKGRVHNLLSLGDVDEAIRTLTDIVLRSPDRETYELLARCYLQVDEVEEALILQELANSPTR